MGVVPDGCYTCVYVVPSAILIADGNGNVMEMLWTRAVLAGGYRECVDKCQLSPMAKLVCVHIYRKRAMYQFAGVVFGWP